MSSRATKRREKKKAKKQHQLLQNANGSAPSVSIATASAVSAKKNLSQSRKQNQKRSRQDEPSNARGTKKEKNGSSTAVFRGYLQADTAGLTSSKKMVAVPSVVASELSHSVKTKHSESKHEVEHHPDITVLDPTAIDLTSSCQGRSYDEILGDEELDSTGRARALLQWLVAPLPVAAFMKEHFEKRPLLVRRHAVDPTWYHSKDAGGDEGLLSRSSIARTIKIQRLRQGEEVTLTHYDPAKGIRQNFIAAGGGGKSQEDAGSDPGPPLMSSQFEEALRTGASVRLLCPQKYSDDLWAVLGALEEAFGARPGAGIIAAA